VGHRRAGDGGDEVVVGQGVNGSAGGTSLFIGTWRKFSNIYPRSRGKGRSLPSSRTVKVNLMPVIVTGIFFGAGP